MHYRRAQIPGAAYFFTVNLANRKLSLLVNIIELLKVAIRHVKMTHPLKVDNPEESVAFGNAGIGNIRYAMTMIWPAPSITFITTQ